MLNMIWRKIKPTFWESFRSSLASEILLKMTAGAIIVVLLVTAIGYWYIFQKSQQEAIAQLKEFVSTRREQENFIFQLAEDNLNVFKQEYLKRYRMGSPYSDADFDALFFHSPDGAIRMKKEYFDGKVCPDGIYRSGMSGFIGNNHKFLSSDLKRRLVIGYHLISELGPLCVTRFANLHATFPENGIILYWPDEPWGLNARANLIMTDGSVVRASLQAYNPQRKPVWTGLYYDLTANQWAITYEVPVDYQGRHLITPSHDVLLNDLINRLLSEHLEGSYNFIVSQDGNLIAHPKKLDEIKKQMGVLSIEKVNDPVLSSMFAQIQKQADPSNSVTIIDDPVNNAYLAVTKLAGPEWWYVSVYPKHLILAKAHTAARIIVVLGLAFFALMMSIVYLVISKSVATPLRSLKQAAEEVSAGKYDKVINGHFNLSESAQNEVSLLSKSFRHMATQVRDASRMLERKIEERTQELEIANRKLTTLSYLDGLTGIKNRRSFDNDLQLHYNWAKEGKHNFVLLFYDVDYFKLYNDYYGHQAGDQVLKTVAKVLKETVGTDENIYRYGGEEFAIIWGDKDGDYKLLAEKLLGAIRGLKLEHKKSPHKIVTISGGVAIYHEEFTSAKEMIIAADKKLYYSKNSGRDQVTY